MYVWMNYMATGQATGMAKTMWALALLTIAIGIAWLAFRFWDLPIREALRRRR